MLVIDGGDVPLEPDDTRSCSPAPGMKCRAGRQMSRYLFELRPRPR
jgi:hypothetical protein